ncbi:hypothetical protein COLO4_28403 [Corchorus olitorius]|uniref:Uncharacterized protein n=1 Tax=Corchorus olitorius TaxID=93759 RepID=A0A1R3HL44_9ROSI|nr:hypothetical protein COLO4_28403 [Corchorus olitorius]
MIRAQNRFNLQGGMRGAIAPSTADDFINFLNITPLGDLQLIFTNL